MTDPDASPLTSTGNLHNATITVRCIRSFEYRTIKNHVFKNMDLTKVTVGQLLGEVKSIAQTAPGWRPYRTVNFDTLKIYTHAHLTKTQNLAINLDHEDWILFDHNKTLAECGILNETELSCFNMELYRQYEANPVDKWDN